MVLSQSYTHDPVGVLSTTTELGLGTDSYAYDPRYRLTGDALAGGSPASPTWSYDGATEITASSTTLNGGAPITTTRSYARDNSLRTLLQVQGGTTQHNLSFGYDAAGNRTGQQDSITGQNLSYTYNQADQLTKYGPIWTYSYNGHGLRATKSGLTAVGFTWDVNAPLPELLSDGTGQYLYGPGGLMLEQIQAGTPYYYHAGRRGSVRAVSDANGNRQATYQYDAYGNTTARTGSLTNSFRYAGGYQDAESGLYYLQARYYDPSTQQFLSVDPLLAVTGQAYNYVGGSPVTGGIPRDWRPTGCAFKLGARVSHSSVAQVGINGSLCFVAAFGPHDPLDLAVQFSPGGTVGTPNRAVWGSVLGLRSVDANRAHDLDGLFLGAGG